MMVQVGVADEGGLPRVPSVVPVRARRKALLATLAIAAGLSVSGARGDSVVIAVIAIKGRQRCGEERKEGRDRASGSIPNAGDVRPQLLGAHVAVRLRSRDGQRPRPFPLLLGEKKARGRKQRATAADGSVGLVPRATRRTGPRFGGSLVFALFFPFLTQVSLCTERKRKKAFEKKKGEEKGAICGSKSRRRCAPRKRPPCLSLSLSPSCLNILLGQVRSGVYKVDAARVVKKKDARDALRRASPFIATASVFRSSPTIRDMPCTSIRRMQRTKKVEWTGERGSVAVQWGAIAHANGLPTDEAICLGAGTGHE